MRRRLFSESEADKEYFKVNIEQREVKDIKIDILYQSRTVTVLVGIIIGLTYFCFTRTNSVVLAENLSQGAITVVVVFLLISTMIMPNGPYVRPHPLIWRMLFGSSLLYLLSLIFCLFLRLNQARNILIYFYPELAVMRHSDILDKEYAVNCSEVTVARIWSHLDIFAWAHFLGWVVKAILLRHYVILWTLSINWEITELAFTHILPNFSECWWDSIVLDVLVCNGLGIWCGMRLCQWLEMRSYHWDSIRDIRTTRGKLKRMALQFTPCSWTATHWLDRNSSIKRGFQLSILIVVWQMSELNTFFLKHIFIVKPSHILTLSRIGIITGMSAPAIRQFYHYITDNQVKRMGTQLWIFTATTLVESLVCFKLGSEVFEKALLWNLLYWLLWLVFTSFLTVFLSLWYAHKSPLSAQSSPQSSPSKVHPPDAHCPSTDDEQHLRQRKHNDEAVDDKDQ